MYIYLYVYTYNIIIYPQASCSFSLGDSVVENTICLQLLFRWVWKDRYCKLDDDDDDDDDRIYSKNVIYWAVFVFYSLPREIY